MTPPTMSPAPPSEEAEAPRFPDDQQRFDAQVSRDGWIFMRVLGGIGIFAALVISVLALFEASRNHSTTMTMNAPTQTVTAPAKTGAAAVPSTGAAAAKTISLSVAGENKKGPDGKMHDSFTKTDFAVKVGQPLRLRITNKDDAPHSITAAGTGVNITVKPGTHTYTMVAKTAGRFQWECILPCDPWAMLHPGYMAGYITAS